MNADGSGQKRLAGLPHRDDWAPAWSPYVVRSNGGGLIRLGVSGEEASWLRPA